MAGGGKESPTSTIPDQPLVPLTSRLPAKGNAGPRPIGCDMKNYKEKHKMEWKYFCVVKRNL